MKKDKQLEKSIKKLLAVSFKDGKIIESQVVKSIKILKSLPTNQSIEALSQYLKGLKRLQREHTLFVETVTMLSPVQLKKIKRILDKKFKITKVVTLINPQILGGFKLRVGDEIWDQSLIGKLNQVKEVISGRYSQSN